MPSTGQLAKPRLFSRDGLSLCHVRANAHLQTTKRTYGQYGSYGTAHIERFDDKRYSSKCLKHSGRHSPPSKEARILPWVCSGLPAVPKKTVHFSVPESTISPNTDRARKPVTVCRTPHAPGANKVPIEPFQRHF